MTAATPHIGEGKVADYGILAIVPGQCSVAAWGPGLDTHGNSVSATIALETFARTSGLSLF
ncbi:glutaminase [Nonomuraea endophytica]|uniref:glutaminase n=1 Tax=Nonomuraea endophytica TaxID=714136 RepID=A0A7W8AFZ8_9ACTN|nr:glutaminase [Nonomuraea endophytica]MBB5084063.1 glutaminase [Nonomuraea endophytica]